MLIIFISLIFIVSFLAIGLLSLNYSVYLWENKKVNDLTSKIKTDNQPSSSSALLQKNSASRGFTSMDMTDSVSVSRSIQTSNPQERMMSDINPDSSSESWINKTFEFFRKLRTNFWTQLNQIIKYLLSLARPSVNIKEEDLKKEEVKQAEVVETVEKVINTPRVDKPQEEPTIDVQAKQSFEEHKSSNVATISFAGSSDEKSELDMTMFEKMENKILQKLKEDGMNHYDIWIDLGKLYEKYTEKEKAKEVYALVLRHSDGKEKDFARDRLIELS